MIGCTALKEKHSIPVTFICHLKKEEDAQQGPHIGCKLNVLQLQIPPPIILKWCIYRIYSSDGKVNVASVCAPVRNQSQVSIQSLRCILYFHLGKDASYLLCCLITNLTEGRREVSYEGSSSARPAGIFTTQSCGECIRMQEIGSKWGNKTKQCTVLQSEKPRPLSIHFKQTE